MPSPEVVHFRMRRGFTASSRKRQKNKRTKKKPRGSAFWIGGMRELEALFLLVFCIGIKGKDGTYPQARKVKRKALSSTSPGTSLPHAAKRKLK